MANAVTLDMASERVFSCSEVKSSSTGSVFCIGLVFPAVDMYKWIIFLNARALKQITALHAALGDSVI